jgi:probable HAF family extracellular repeat protein
MNRIVAILSMLLACSAPAQVSVSYRVLPAGYPVWPDTPSDNPGQAFSFFGRSINDAGYVAGWATISTPGTPPSGHESDYRDNVSIYNPSTNKVGGVGLAGPVNQVVGRDAFINNLNHLVVSGVSSDPTPNAPLFYNGSTFQSMGKFNGLTYTVPLSINDNDLVLGTARPGLSAQGAVPWMWTPQGGYSTLPLPTGTSQAAVLAVNNHDVFAGNVLDAATGRGHAATWNLSGGYTDLLPDVFFSYASDINDAGQVVGTFNEADGIRHGFLWRDGNLTDLGSFSPSEISNSGIILGFALGESSNFKSAVWVEGQVANISDILPPDYTTNGTANLIYLALAGNQIVAPASHVGIGVETLVFTVSVPEPAAVGSLGLMCGGLLLRRRSVRGDRGDSGC